MGFPHRRARNDRALGIHPAIIPAARSIVVTDDQRRASRNKPSSTDGSSRFTGPSVAVLIVLWLALWARLRAHYGGPWMVTPTHPCERHILAWLRCPGHPVAGWFLPGVGTDIACTRCGFLLHLGM